MAGRCPQTIRACGPARPRQQTASVLPTHALGVPAFPVDTHIHRVAARWRLSSGKNVVTAERDPTRLFPRDTWNRPTYRSSTSAANTARRRTTISTISAGIRSAVGRRAGNESSRRALAPALRVYVRSRGNESRPRLASRRAAQHVAPGSCGNMFGGSGSTERRCRTAAPMYAIASRHGRRTIDRAVGARQELRPCRRCWCASFRFLFFLAL